MLHCSRQMNFDPYLTYQIYSTDKYKGQVKCMGNILDKKFTSCKVSHQMEYIFCITGHLGG